VALIGRLRALVRWLAAEVDHLIWRSGIRGYCHRCDALRWAWTHRGHGCWAFEMGRKR
jgi:hypothetical protein